MPSQYLTHRTRGVTSKHQARLANRSFAFGPPIILEPARTFPSRTLDYFFLLFLPLDSGLHFFLLLPLDFGPHLFSAPVWDHGLFLVFSCIWTLHYLRHVSSTSGPKFSSLFSPLHYSHKVISLRTFLFLGQRHCSVASFLRLLFVSVLYFLDWWRWGGGRVMSTLGDIFLLQTLPTATSSVRIISPLKLQASRLVA